MCVIAAMGLLVAPNARADVFDDNPAAVTFQGQVYVFARNADNRIIVRHTSGGTWTGWTPVPGLAAGSGPGAVVYGQSIRLFARGQDGQLWENQLVEGRWFGWQPLDGGLTSAPSAGVRLHTATLEVAVRGTDNALYYRTYTPANGWYGWAGLGGNLGSAPTVTGYHTSQSIDIFARDANGSVIQYYQVPGQQWVGPAGQDGIAVGAPTSTFAHENRLDVYVRGANNGLYYYEHPADTLWSLIDARPLDSSPAATSDRPGHELIFARIGNDLHMKQVSIPGPGAGPPSARPWVSLGPIGLPPDKQAPPPGPGPGTGPAIVTPPPRPDRLMPLISFRYRASRTRTRFTKLVVKNVPVGATVRVSCARGCSAKRFTYTQRRARQVSLKRLIRRPIRVGRKLVVTVTKPGMIGIYKVLTIRPSDEPRITTRCLPPGVTRPQVC
jgi:hypothetical protein